MKTNDLLERLLAATKPMTCLSWHVSYHREHEIRSTLTELAAAVAAGARLMIPEPAEIVHWWPGGIDDPVACGVSAANQGYHFRFESHPMAAHIVTCPECRAILDGERDAAMSGDIPAQPAEPVHYWPGGTFGRGHALACGLPSREGHEWASSLSRDLVTCPECLAAMQPPTPRTWGVLTMDGA